MHSVAETVKQNRQRKLEQTNKQKTWACSKNNFYSHSSIDALSEDALLMPPFAISDLHTLYNFISKIFD